MAENRKNIFLAAVSGIILGFSYPGSALNLGFFAWFGLIPLFLALKNSKRGFLVGYAVGLVYFLIVFRWYWYFYPLDSLGINSRLLSVIILFFVYAIVSAAMALFWGLFGYFFSKIKKQKMEFFAAPALFVLFEFVRSFGFGIVMAGQGTLYGPHWTMGNIAYGLANNFLILKISSFIGVYGILFLIVFANFLLFSLVRGQFKFKFHFIALIIILISLSYLYRPPIAGDQQKINYTIIQTNEAAKIDPTSKEELDAFKKQLALLNQIATKSPDSVLIVFPEGSDFFKSISNFLTTSQSQTYFGNLFKNSRLVISGVKIIDTDRKAKSRVIALDTKEGIIGYYDKRLLTPGGEFLPYPIEFIVNKISKNTVGQFGRYREFGIGNKSTSKINFQNKFSISPLVCSELLSPDLTRKTIGDGNIIVGMSSTAIYHGADSAIQELLAIARFRAAENAKPLILAANMGRSYAIDDNGKIQNLAKNEDPQILTGSVAFSQEKSWYNKYGDWPILAPTLIMLIYVLCLHIKKQNKLGIIHRLHERFEKKIYRT